MSPSPNYAKQEEGVVEERPVGSRSRKSHRRGNHSGGGSHDAAGMGRWLLTYADMITLLLALFIILFAISTINGKKFIAFERGVAEAFGVQKPGISLLPDSTGLLQKPTIAPTQKTASGRASSNLSQTDSKIAAALKAAGLSQDASVIREKQSVIVRMFADTAYFASDSATLQPVGEEVIDTVASVLKAVPSQVEVEGYTDDVPITGGPYTSNWELSGARASAAVVRLISHDGITPSRLIAVGFGTTHPIASNASPEGRAKNRHVDIVILTTTHPLAGATAISEGSSS